MNRGGVELDRPVASIQVGYRFRQDLGDLDELCASIQKLGLLQPITITPDGTLVCGARRLAAVKRLGWDRVKVWITASVSTRLAEVLAERDENTIRKPFTPTEAAALYAELKELYAADAAHRQQATRFGDGGGKLPPPYELAPAGKARQRAARAITGRDSSRSLDHVVEVQRLVRDPSTPERVRAIARNELAAMDTDGTIHSHYLNVRAAASGDAAGQDQAAAELVEAAQAAIVRATSSEDADETGSRSTGRRLVAIKRYGLRAFLATIEEMDGWWRHYDPDEIAAGLSDEQWQRLCACLDASTEFIHAIDAARHHRTSDDTSADRPPRAVCF